MNNSSKKHETENNIWRKNSGDTENKVIIDVLRSTVSQTKHQTQYNKNMKNFLNWISRNESLTHIPCDARKFQKLKKKKDFQFWTNLFCLAKIVKSKQ